VTSWTWSFGDGGTSTQRNPTRTYQNPGTYPVTLTVTGPEGSSTMTKPGFVRVFDGSVSGLWASSAELQVLPMSGAAWNSLLAEADRSTGTPDVANQDDDVDVRVLAKAIVFARTGQASYRQDVIAACMAAIGTEAGGRTLALGRNLIGYVIAADLVGLPAAEDALFRDWLEECLVNTYDGKTLVETHEERPNNWGTHAGGSRVAVAAYLGDTAELARCAQVFKGWLGDRSAYAGFDYGDLSWQSDPSRPVGINPRGATIDGHDVDGVLPDDQRRGGGFTWPPPKENYVWEALQGALAQAVILARNGYPDVWQWSDQALLRAVDWLHDECNYPAEADDTWQPHVVNFFYGSGYPAPVPSSPGKNVGWTDFTLQ
jgi:PKD repeat protein